MIVRAQKGSVLSGKTVEVDDITYIICYADDHTPLVVVEQVGKEVVQITRHGEPEFGHILTRLGARQEVRS
jgi:hypothetical protein